VADDYTINARNQRLREIKAEGGQGEQNTAQSRTVHGARNKLLSGMEESAISACKIPYENFLQTVRSEIQHKPIE
jgi:hypothetical protein